MTAAHFVYEAFDTTGQTIYVGCSKNFTARMQGHFQASPWSSLAVRFNVVRYEDQRSALAAEEALIREREPRFNVMYVPSRTQDRLTAMQEDMAAEHELNPDCPYHWRKKCPTCEAELNTWIGIPQDQERLAEDVA